MNINFDASNVAVVTADRNVYSYNPSNKTWISKEGNLQVAIFYDIAADPNDPNTTYGIAQDQVAAMKFSGDIEWGYMEGAGGETGKMLVDPSDSSRLYVSNPLDPTTFVARSSDGGQNWQKIFVTTDFSSGDYGLAYALQKSFTIDPSNPARLLIGTTKVWETQDATIPQPVWSDISGVLSPSSSASSQHIIALAVAPSDPKIIYAATGDGHVWATTDGGGSWQPRENGLFSAGPRAGARAGQ